MNSRPIRYSVQDNRTIIHLDLDTFFVSVERLVNSSLMGKPIIIGGMSDRGVVSSTAIWRTLGHANADG